MLLDLAAGVSLQPVIGAFQPDFWMTSYEASFFLDDDRVAALRTSSGHERLGEVA